MERRNNFGSDSEVSPCKEVGYTAADQAVKKHLFNANPVNPTQSGCDPHKINGYVDVFKGFKENNFEQHI